MIERRFSAIAAVWPLLPDAELADLAEDIREHGQRDPIVLDRDGLILDGRNRWLAIRKLKLDGHKIEPITRTYEGDDPIGFAVSVNTHRRHLDASQRALVAAKIATLRQGSQTGQVAAPTQAEAASALGVGERSVRRARKLLGDAAPEIIAAVERGELSVGTASDVARLPQDEQVMVLASARMASAGSTASRASARNALMSSHSCEWYTPSAYIEAARKLMGSIDLDPASCTDANETVRAGTIYTASEDGLSREWRGNVWCNPPYGPGGQSAWAAKVIEEHDAGRIDKAVLLVNATTEAVWFSDLWRFPICFVLGRIKFVSPGGSAGRQPTHGSAIVGIGVDDLDFEAAFRKFGRIVIPGNGLSTSK